MVADEPIPQRDPQRHEREDQRDRARRDRPFARGRPSRCRTRSTPSPPGVPPTTAVRPTGSSTGVALAGSRRRRGPRRRSRSGVPAASKGGRVSFVIADPEVRRAPDHVDRSRAPTQISHVGGRVDGTWVAVTGERHPHRIRTRSRPAPSEASDRLARAMAEWETVIGLECHVELSTRTKMFCGCRNEFGAEPNTLTCPVCLGHPGSLPVPNARGDRADREDRARPRESRSPRARCSTGRTTSIRTCRRTTRSASTTCPRASAAIWTWSSPTGRRRASGITRVHMEEDTGKTAHGSASGRIHEAEYALIDYNRAGVPLVECVSEPDMRSPEEAGAYLRELRALLGVARRLRRPDGGRVAPLRRERLGAPAGGGRARHQGRDQEHELGPVARARARLRGRPADRGARGGRAARAGDAALGRGLGHHEDDALEGGGVRLPLLPGARHPRAGAGRRVDRGDPGVLAASSRALGAPGTWTSSG